ncbi:M4 family metallopeptidase [Maribacter sp.]|uniref:M4 family metallopeptidase n=1 Tax=Maribacter sp. TaxID=1897614 RepID=UPI0025C46AD0|nr:M4 family metallopeptidase [Maribacter sp.]
MRPILFLLVLVMPFIVISQANISTPLEQFQNNKIRYYKDLSLDRSNFFAKKRAELNLSDQDKFLLISDRPDKSGYARLKYQQYHKDIKVKGAVYTLHEKDGRIIKSTGNIFPIKKVDILNAPLQKTFAKGIEEQFESKLIQDQDIDDITHVSWSSSYKETVIMDKSHPEFSGNYALAHGYEISSYDFEEPIKHLVYFDAHNGKISNSFSIIQGHATKARAKTLYYGEQEIITDSIAPDRYLLRDLTRGQGIITLDANTDRDTFWDSDNIWDTFNEQRDEVAHDAHYCTSKYYDMMQEYFDWDGLDGQGGELVSVVHVRGRYYVNAYWDGSRTNYGNGDCDRYGPLTTLDVVGHEFAHGWTNSTSNLIYRNESGALNESISDIIGKGLEHYADPQNFNWYIGDRFRLSEEVNYFRSLENPHERSDPKYYGGDYWRTGTADNGGVHTNSGVFNYWFYLLVEGGAGTNETPEEYNVASIGWKDALDIVFVSQTGYLTESSNYFDCMYATLEATADLFGEESDQYRSVLESWKAVGLYPDIDNLDLGLELESGITTICDTTTDHFASVIIRNKGRSTYPMTDSIIIRFVQNRTTAIQESLSVPLDLAVGDSIIYTFKTPIKLNPDNAGTYVIEVWEVDNNRLNNRVTGNIFMSEIQGLDLELSNFSLSNRTLCEGTSPTRYIYGYRNRGCEILDAGDTIFFDVKTDKGNFTIIRPLQSAVLPLNYYGGSASLFDIEIPDGIKDYNVTIRHSSDINEDNDQQENSYSGITHIVKGYLEKYEETHRRDYYEINTVFDSYDTDTIISWQQNNGLAIAAIDDVFYRACPDVEGIFSSTSLTSEIVYCIDASDMSRPIFEFNLAQFLNQNRFDVILDESFGTIVQVKTDSTTFPLIYGQEEGVVYKRKFDLVSGYKGPLIIEVLTQSGGALGAQAADFFTDRDIAFFDNTTLREGIDQNQEFSEQGFVIFPNPTSHFLYVQNENPELEFDLSIFNSIGQLVMSRNKLKGIRRINCSGMASGIYYISFLRDGKIIDTLPLIKE